MCANAGFWKPLLYTLVLCLPWTISVYLAVLYHVLHHRISVLYLVLIVTTMFGEDRGKKSQVSQLLPLLQLLLIGSKEEPFLLQLLCAWSANMAFQTSHVCEIIQIVAVQMRTKFGPKIWAVLID